MDTGLLLLRLTLGLTLGAHGAQMLFGWFGGGGPSGTGHFLEQLGFKPGWLHAVAAGLSQFVAGTLLILGLATPLAATLTVGAMIVAAVSVHVKKGFFITGGGIEYNLVLGVAVWLLAFTGPGTFSLDAVLGWDRAGGAWGAAALVLGTLGAAVELAQRDPLPGK